jgi:hypothetical protein
MGFQYVLLSVSPDIVGELFSLSPFSLWEKGWGRGTKLRVPRQTLSPTLSQRERELANLEWLFENALELV